MKKNQMLIKEKRSMKRIKFYLLLNVALFFFAGHVQSQTDFTLARVGYKIHGVYVYVLAEPVAEYIFVETIKVGIKDTRRETFLKAIQKAKKKHKNFNGMIFRYNDLNQADLIRIEGVHVTRGGIKVHDKVMYSRSGNVYYGAVVELLDDKEAKIKHIGIYGDIVVSPVEYRILTVIDDVAYNKAINAILDNVNNHQFKLSDQVIWVLGTGPEKGSYTGTIIGFSRDGHKANVEYIEDNITKVKKVNILDLHRLSDSNKL